MTTILDRHLRNIQTILNIKNRLDTKLTLLEKQYGINDFRYELIGRPCNTIVLQILIFKANEQTFHNDKWWDSIEVPIEGRKGFSERYNVFTKFLGFIQFLSSVESQMRILIRKFQPLACNEGKASFESIYTKILTGLGLTNYIAAFQLATSLRNSMHNNGFYLPTSHTNDREIVFRNNKFVFKYNTEINFAYIDLLSDIQEEIYNCLFKIVDNPKIKGL